MRPCIFCEIVAGRAPCSEVYQDASFMAFMDIHPFSPGHVLVIPKRHWTRVGQVPSDTRQQLFELTCRLAQAVRESSIACDDLHFLINDGRHASQTVPHVHMHILPRRRGDAGARIAGLLARPFVSLLGPAPGARLDRQAALIRAHIDQ